MMVLAFPEVSVAHAAVATKTFLDLLASHEVERALMSLVSSLEAGAHSKLILMRLGHLSTGRHTLILISLLARETRILDLMRTAERGLSVVRAARLELRLLIVRTEVDLGLVLKGSRLVESLVDVNRRSEDGARGHNIGTNVTFTRLILLAFVVTKTEVTGATGSKVNLGGGSRALRTELGRVGRLLVLLTSNLRLPRGSLVIEIHDCIWRTLGE
jgi:hypothetical protein